MPESSMPQPGIVLRVCCPADRFGDVDVEDVEAAGVAGHLGEEAALDIANTQHDVLDEYLVPTSSS
jgi:hypothetical protein